MVVSLCVFFVSCCCACVFHAPYYWDHIEEGNDLCWTMSTQHSRELLELQLRYVQGCDFLTIKAYEGYEMTCRIDRGALFHGQGIFIINVAGPDILEYSEGSVVVGLAKPLKGELQFNSVLRPGGGLNVVSATEGFQLKEIADNPARVTYCAQNCYIEIWRQLGVCRDGRELFASVSVFYDTLPLVQVGSVVRNASLIFPKFGCQWNFRCKCSLADAVVNAFE